MAPVQKAGKFSAKQRQAHSIVKDVLVHVGDSSASEARVSFALSFAEGYGAHLTGMHVTPDADVPTGTRLARLDTLVSLREKSDANEARRARELFLGVVRSASVSSNWLSAQGDISAHVAAAARYADLVIVGQEEWQGDPIHHPLPICHQIVLKAGRPLLVIPESYSKTAEFDRILIAWDGSRESVRAVHDAIPILQRASDVRVIVVQSTREHLSSDVCKREPLSDHLMRHGIAVSKWTTDEHAGHIAERIREETASADFDLLIMGAYSRPEWFEYIAGGTTQSLLLTSSIPLLISH